MLRLRFAFGCLLFVLILSGCATPPSSPAPADQPADLKAAEAELGIEPVAVYLTSAGFMLDFRYRVTAVEPAKAVLNRNSKVFLLHEKTGKVLIVPTTAKVGPLRQSTIQPEEGRIYFMMFGNAGQLVKRGDSVTLIINDQRFEHLTVE